MAADTDVMAVVLLDALPHTDQTLSIHHDEHQTYVVSIAYTRSMTAFN